MASNSLSTLPTEMRDTIVEYVVKPSDLKSLCLSCKALRLAALPRLYHTVELDLEQCPVPTLNGFFLPSNVGPAYTRTLNFTNALEHDAAMAWRTMSRAVQCLTRDSLVVLKLPGTLTLDLDFLLALCAYQRRLTGIALPAVGDSIAQATSSPEFTWEWLQNVQWLSLPPCIHGRADVQGLHEIIRYAGKLTQLRIVVCKTFSNKSLDNQMDATASGDGVLLPTLLRHVAPFGTGPALRLTGLILALTDLQFSTRLLDRAIEFGRLRKLKLYHCGNASALLVAMTRTCTSNLLALKLFDYDGHAIQKPVIENFLHSFHGLAALAIRYNTGATEGAPFDLSCLKEHGESLRSLTIHMLKRNYVPGENDTFPLSLAEVCVICKACPRLQKVVIASPPSILGGVCSLDFRLAVDQLVKLPLRVLRLVNWPVMPGEQLLAMRAGTNGETANERQRLLLSVNQQQIQCSMQVFATDTMQRIATIRGVRDVSKLPTLKIGAKFPLSSHAVVSRPYMEVEMKPLCFIGTFCTDRFGRQLIKAEYIRAEDLKYLEGRTPI